MCWPGLTNSFLSWLVLQSRDPDWTAWCSRSVGVWVGGEGCGKGAIKAVSVHKRKICEKKSGCETYLEVPLQRCDILTAHLNIIQSHLRQKGKSDWRFVMANRTPSDSLLNLPRCNWRPASRQLIQIQLNKLVKRLFDAVILKMKALTQLPQH